MQDNTINHDRTMGGATGTLLAGRYRVVRQLGQGGMGSVWLAEDLKLDGHKVAVKMLPSILVSNKRAYNQLKSEALVALKLTHPNIATVRAFEENEGNPFLVMDYIDGLTLDEYLAKKGKLSEETTYCLLEPVARALDYAHERGIVHRDVKPGNVMVTWDGDPFVLDFGIAREIQETMTRVTGKLSSGTLLYMSPEQLKGASPKPAQDVYSFAAMAYECLKGEPPFSRGQVEWQILNQAPEPLVGGVLATSIMCGLAKDPAQRPATCRGVLAAKRPSAHPSFTAPRPKAEAAKPAAGTPTNKVVPPFDIRAAVLNNKWLAFALIAVFVGIIFKNVDFKASGRSSPASVVTEAQPEEPVDISELDKTRIEAQVKVAACRRLDRGDGFGAKIEECENGLVRAKAEYDLKRWGDALRDYKAVLKQSVALAALDADRLRARAAAAKMERQVRELKGTDVARYAAERFNAARELVVQAKDAFAEMRFAEAADKHELAARQFELAAGEAKREKERQEVEQAREDERRKEIADLRTACETSRRLAVESEANKFAFDEMVAATKSFLDADKAAETDRKQAYQAAIKAFEHARELAIEAAKPTLFLTASLAGVEKSALVTEGLSESGIRTPVTVKISQGLGESGEFAVEYEEGGRAYRGRATYWVKKGRQVLDVKMFDVTAFPAQPAAANAEETNAEMSPRQPKGDLDELLMDLEGENRRQNRASCPPGIKFCRHCGARLADYSNVGNTCPSCGRNLFGD